MRNPNKICTAPLVWPDQQELINIARFVELVLGGAEFLHSTLPCLTVRTGLTGWLAGMWLGRSGYVSHSHKHMPEMKRLPIAMQNKETHRGSCWDLSHTLRHATDEPWAGTHLLRPGGGEILCTRSDRLWDPSTLLYNGSRASLAGDKADRE